jgi:hypothetical protein
MRRPNADALIYCIAWVALAVAGWRYAGLKAGLLLSVGLFLVVMPASALTLSRTGSFAVERAVRWGILILAAVALASYVDVGGTG